MAQWITPSICLALFKGHGRCAMALFLFRRHKKRTHIDDRERMLAGTCRKNEKNQSVGLECLKKGSLSR